jgi:galactoside O-acetyltransferase
MKRDLDETALPRELRSGNLLDNGVLKSALQGCGVGVRVYEGCRLVPPDRIRLGDFSQIDEGVRVFAGEGVRIGRHVHLAFGCCVGGGGRCEIGDYAGISTGVRIITGSEEIEGGLTNPTIPEDLRRVRRSQVVIGRHALLFAGVIVLPGVTIGEGAVVAAGSVVHRNLEGWRIYAGNPLVCVGVRKREPILALEEVLEMRERGDGKTNLVAGE